MHIQKRHFCRCLELISFPRQRCAFILLLVSSIAIKELICNAYPWSQCTLFERLLSLLSHHEVCSCTPLQSQKVIVITFRHLGARGSKFKERVFVSRIILHCSLGRNAFAELDIIITNMSRVDMALTFNIIMVTLNLISNPLSWFHDHLVNTPSGTLTKSRVICTSIHCPSMRAAQFCQPGKSLEYFPRIR